MQIVKEQITVEELKKMSENMFGNLVKAVVDIEQEIMVVDAELHADEEEVLLELGSEQKNLWGINFHPDKIPHENWVEFDSMINIRPRCNNMSRYVHDPKIREKIISIVTTLVKK